VVAQPAVHRPQQIGQSAAQQPVGDRIASNMKFTRHATRPEGEIERASGVTSSNISRPRVTDAAQVDGRPALSEVCSGPLAEVDFEERRQIDQREQARRPLGFAAEWNAPADSCNIASRDVPVLDTICSA